MINGDIARTPELDSERLQQLERELAERRDELREAQERFDETRESLRSYGR